MTPQEKAKELITKYSPLVPGWDCYHDSPRDDEDIAKDAKRCAIVLIDEVIQALEKLCGDVSVTHYWHPLDYWKEVKSEIENL